MREDEEPWSFSQTIFAWTFIVLGVPGVLFLILWVLHHFGYHP